MNKIFLHIIIYSIIVFIMAALGLRPSWLVVVAAMPVSMIIVSKISG